MNKSIFTGRDTLHVDHRLLREERVCRQPRHQVDGEAGYGTVSGMFDLRHVLQLIVDCLDQRPLSQEDFVGDRHELAFHVALQLCYQLYAVHEKPGKEILAYVPLVSDQLAENLLDEGFVPERLPVVDIAGGEHEVQYFSLFAADQMKLEAVEPPHGTLPSLCKALEDLVEADALVTTHAQGGAVHEADASAGSHAAPLHEKDERDSHLPLQFDETVIGDSLWEQVSPVFADLIQVKVLKAFISAQMEQYHDGDHLGIGQFAVPMIFPLGPVTYGSESVCIDKSVIYPAEVICHTENFCNFVSVNRHSESFCVCIFVFSNLQKFSLFS